MRLFLLLSVSNVFILVALYTERKLAIVSASDPNHYRSTDVNIIQIMVSKCF